jgi:hypothetical protein
MPATNEPFPLSGHRDRRQERATSAAVDVSLRAGLIEFQ